MGRLQLARRIRAHVGVALAAAALVLASVESNAETVALVPALLILTWKSVV